MKIFVSYSRRDSGDFADQIQKYFSTFNYDVFTDTSSNNAGDVWSSVIDVNISKCDIFVALITYGSLLSPHVEKEVLQAQRANKIIIPCIQKVINHGEIKWGLNNIQGIEFDDKYELARKLYLKIVRINQQRKDATSTQDIEVSRSIEFRIKEGDIKNTECDVVILKYAQEFYQVDYQVASALGVLNNLVVPVGEYRYLSTAGKLPAKNVLFIGVPELKYFNYEQIRQFPSTFLDILSEIAPHTVDMVMTFHIASLDETEAALSLFAGLLDGLGKKSQRR